MNQLKGFKVLELASVLAGPGVGQFFAEVGADVIKVENSRSGGDVTRSWKGAGEQTDDRSAYFCSVNWGKRSIAVDLASKHGQQIIHKLAMQSDLVVASYKPGDAEKFNVDYQTLSKLNPEIIYGQITGYGSNNPKVGYDAILQAEAGFMYMNGEPGGRSLKMPVALVDILAGHQLKEALLLAIIDRLKSAKGMLVEVSLIQAAISSLANQATNWLIANQLPTKKGSAHPNIAPYGDMFHTRDNKEFLVAVGNDRQFVDLCHILGLKKISDDVRFRTNTSRVENRSELNRILENEISQIDADVLMRRLNDAKVPAGIIQNMEQVFQMPEANEIQLESNGLKSVKTFIAAGRDSFPSHFLPPPRLGEHTFEILSNRLGFSSQFIDSLRADGVVL